MNKKTVTVTIARQDPDTVPALHYQSYDVPIVEKTTVLQVLNAIYEYQDRTMAFRRFCCGYKFCNSCAMMINGQSANACHTFVEAGDQISLEPLAEYPVIRDLVVDFGPADARIRNQGAHGVD